MSLFCNLQKPVLLASPQVCRDCPQKGEIGVEKEFDLILISSQSA